MIQARFDDFDDDSQREDEKRRGQASRPGTRGSRDAELAGDSEVESGQDETPPALDPGLDEAFGSAEDLVVDLDDLELAGSLDGGEVDDAFDAVNLLGEDEDLGTTEAIDESLVGDMLADAVFDFDEKGELQGRHGREQDAGLTAGAEDLIGGVVPATPPGRLTPEPSRADEAPADPIGVSDGIIAGAEGLLPGLSVQDLQAAIEAILFATSEPVTVRQLAEVFEASVHDVREAVESLRAELDDTQRAFELVEVAGGLQLLTLARLHPWIVKFREQRKAQRLSAAALETLAVIAYKQPISKATLEGIRGVHCAPILKTLMDRGLVKIVGREDSLGRPLLYGTTPHFLESFGLSSLEHLPQPEDFGKVADSDSNG